MEDLWTEDIREGHKESELYDGYAMALEHTIRRQRQEGVMSHYEYDLHFKASWELSQNTMEVGSRLTKW